MNSLSQKRHAGFNNNGTIQTLTSYETINTRQRWAKASVFASEKRCEYAVRRPVLLFTVKPLCSLLFSSSFQTSWRRVSKITDPAVWDIKMVFFWGNCCMTFWLCKGKVRWEVLPSSIHYIPKKTTWTSTFTYSFPVPAVAQSLGVPEDLCLVILHHGTSQPLICFCFLHPAIMCWAAQPAPVWCGRPPTPAFSRRDCIPHILCM